jgi:hypothetical protein
VLERRGTGVAYDVDRAVELDRQVATLVDKGYPSLTGLTESDFVALLSPLRDAVADLPPAADDRIPFVLVVTGLAREQAFARVDLRGKPGFTTMEPDDLARFVPVADVEVPAATAYVLADIDTGQDTLGVPPEDAMPTILAAGRGPLTLDEGIAVVTHHPDLLATGNRFSMLGSRCGDRRVTAIWVSERRPRLGWCWAGAPHTWLGSASGGARVT